MTESSITFVHVSSWEFIVFARFKVIVLCPAFLGQLKSSSWFYQLGVSQHLSHELVQNLGWSLSLVDGALWQLNLFLVDRALWALNLSLVDGALWALNLSLVDGALSLSLVDGALSLSLIDGALNLSLFDGALNLSLVDRALILSLVDGVMSPKLLDGIQYFYLRPYNLFHSDIFFWLTSRKNIHKVTEICKKIFFLKTKFWTEPHGRETKSVVPITCHMYKLDF